MQGGRRGPTLVTTLALAALFFFGVTAARAMTFLVSKTADTNDGSCNADCSLREAIIAANALPGKDRVELPAGSYSLVLAGAEEDAGATGDLDVTDDLELVGAGEAATSIAQSAEDRVLHVLGVELEVASLTVRDAFSLLVVGGGILNQGGDLTVREATITNNVSLAGGGILSCGTLSVTDSRIDGNGAFGAGGISNGPYPPCELDSTATLVDSSVSNGSAGFVGRAGGIFNAAGSTFSAIRTTISGNSVNTDPFGTHGEGAGIINGGTFFLTDSTVSGNRTGANGSGGGIRNEGSLIATNATISGNTTGGGSSGMGAGIHNTATGSVTASNTTIVENVTAGTGGGIQNEGSVTVANTIIAENATADCAGTALLSQGHNLDTDASCGLGDPSDLPGLASAGLGPLQDNGGATPTHAPLAGSPALEAGDPAPPGSGGNACPAADQRGVARPQAARCDIGAVELRSCENGVLDPGEGCDDGNAADGDGCDASCQIEPCFQCTGQPSVCACGGPCLLCFTPGTCSDSGGSCACLIGP